LNHTYTQQECFKDISTQISRDSIGLPKLTTSLNCKRFFHLLGLILLIIQFYYNKTETTNWSVLLIKKHHYFFQVQPANYFGIL